MFLYQVCLLLLYRERERNFTGIQTHYQVQGGLKHHHLHARKSNINH